MAGSSLFGKFISNTFQRIMQIDNDNSTVSEVNVVSVNPASSDQTTILNGLGQINTKVTVDRMMVVVDSLSNQGMVLIKHLDYK